MIAQAHIVCPSGRLSLPETLGITWPPGPAQADAEIIVTFEATTEFGNPFLSRQSYLPNEIHWRAA